MPPTPFRRSSNLLKLLYLDIVTSVENIADTTNVTLAELRTLQNNVMQSIGKGISGLLVDQS